MTRTYDFFYLLDSFISASEKGKHLKKNGSRMRTGSTNNYVNLRKLLLRFCIATNMKLDVTNLIKCTQREFQRERLKWKRIYKKLTRYLYDECNHYDNYVGSIMKLLRSFFNFLKIEKGIDTRDISKLFYVSKEEIPIVVLNAEQLNFLISDKEFEEQLSKKLRIVKDIFVFGCTVGLRISDLQSLNKSNLEKNYSSYYIKVQARKTAIYTRIKIPDYAVKIIERYYLKCPTLLPKIQLSRFNKRCKELAENAGWTYSMDKKRSKRGVVKNIKKQGVKSRQRFCDLISSHTMRRTAITLYLSLGMPEQLVRRISGHSPGSKEFFRYVKYSEEILDIEISKAHSKFLKTAQLN